jgi:HD superfamily phosphohydrolase
MRDDNSKGKVESRSLDGDGDESGSGSKNKIVAEISDPVHGYFYLNRLERYIVDSSVFQRLRRIRQLSSAYLTYPSAQHTRFEHSLGTMHLAGRVSKVLKDKGYIDDDGAQLLRLAALLHDIGHGPFSHLFEEVIALKSNVSHEDIGSRMIKEFFSDILSKYGYTADEVSKLAFYEVTERYMNEVISGGLSADLMDYLLRDSYFTGAHYGRIDAERIISSLEVRDNRLALDKAALNSFISLLLARYQMFMSVYFHKTVRAAEVMLLKAMQLADGYMHLTESYKRLEEYLRLTDDHLLFSLLNLPDKDGLRLARMLAEGYRDRRLFKSVYERKIQTDDPIINRLTDVRYLSNRAMEIAEEAGVDHDLVYIDSAKAPSIPRAPGRTDISDLIIIDKGNARIISIKDVPLIAPILGFMNMIRVYTTEQYRDRVKKACNSVLGDEVEWYERVSV